MNSERFIPVKRFTQELVEDIAKLEAENKKLREALKSSNDFIESCDYFSINMFMDVKAITSNNRAVLVEIKEISKGDK